MPDTVDDRQPANGGTPGPSLERRTLLTGAGAALGVGALGVPSGTAGTFARPGDDPVSMAMHIHGSFSEGVASMDAHLDQARRLGVDVIWWTDHDFRLSGHRYRTAVGFDGASEPDGAWDWTWSALEQGPLAQGAHAFVSAPANPAEAGNKMRLTATATAGADATWATYMVEAQAQNSTYSTNYCDTTLDLDLRPQQASSDTRIVIEAVSSYRPASAGRPAGQYRLQYRVGGQVGYSTEEDGLLGVIGLASLPADTWSRVTLNLRDDHAQLWPDTVADDASLWRLRLGLQVRAGATSQVLFDRLRFHRARSTPAEGVALLQDVIRQYATRYPDVTQFAAAEVSLVMHLNSFGGDLTLPTYDRETQDSSMAAQRAMVKLLHEHGATVALNHPLTGTKGPTDLARRLITSNANGADVIEVGIGPGPTPKMISVFDTACRNAVFITANGTTDDHKGRDWLARRRWLTRVWSPTKRRADLCAGLEAGRAWFYDPLRWDGAFNLRINGVGMGGVLFTPNRRVDVAIRATELPAGATVDLVVGRCDLAGPTVLRPANRVRHLAARRFKAGLLTTTVDRGSGSYIRATIRSARGDLIAFSNPIWVLPPSRRDDVTVPRLRR